MGSSTDVALSGTSLPAPNVQEMVRNNPLHVPQRYFRNVVDMPKDGDTSHGRSSEMVNHEVAREVMERMKDSAAKFFKLPLEEKNKISMPLDEMQGYGHSSVVSEDQMLEWSDRLTLAVHPSKYRNPKVWPPTPFK
ncbi:putative (S)-norcoclaurine synthase [Rosa chinensis]|uniref:Putative (S)-norcoclaurine synthase n=2 Tax=Rosa chinensis TaxID=74649 RepID=A0A2P6R9Z5_ROSCH|nr:putative (S)-norcoclaurine synthase [Rosa chinensis]